MARRAGEVRGRSCRRTRLRRPRSWPPFKLTATRCRPTRRPKKRSAALAACWAARPSCAAAATRVRTSARTASAAETELRPEAAASAANRRRPKTFSSEFFFFYLFLLLSNSTFSVVCSTISHSVVTFFLFGFPMPDERRRHFLSGDTAERAFTWPADVGTKLCLLRHFDQLSSASFCSSSSSKDRAAAHFAQRCLNRSIPTPPPPLSSLMYFFKV